MARFPVVNPFPTEAEWTAANVAVFNFLKANGAKDADEAGREQYFGSKTGKLIVRYALTIGDGGPRDLGPTLLAQLAKNGGIIYDLAGGGHLAWQTAAYEFVNAAPDDVPDTDTDAGEWKNRALSAEEKLKNAENTIAVREARIAALEAQLAELVGEPTDEVPIVGGPSGQP